MKMKNMLIGGMSLALVACISVGATLAYLTDQSNTVKNTFTVGEGYINNVLTLDETLKKDAKNPTEISSTDRTEGTVTQDYAPVNIGDKIAKDPTFHVAANSASSYVFAKVSGVDELISKEFKVSTADPETLTTVEQINGVQNGLNTEKWVKVANEDGKAIAGNVADDGKLNGYYRYKTVVSTSETVTDLEPLFQSVVLPADVTTMPDLGEEGMSIDVAGAIIQSENLTPDSARDEVLKLEGFGPAASNEG